jgi:predicted transcriptional regulator of viral defense system
MYVLKKLSGLEQKLYFLLEAYGILRKMEQKGALGKVKANLYVRIPAHIVHDKGRYAEDSIIVAAHLVGPYFLSYYTALALHGLAQQAASQVYVTTTKQTKVLSYKGSVIRPVRLAEKKFFGMKQIEYRGEKVAVSDLERTVVDVLSMPEYAGGYVFDLLKELVKTPDGFLEELQASLSENTYYFEKSRGGKFVSKWKIVVDPRLEKATEGV